MRSRIKLFPPNPLSSLVFFIQTSSGRVIIFSSNYIDRESLVAIFEPKNISVSLDQA